MNRFAHVLAEHSLPLRHAGTEILQVNVGTLCNLTCVHCHVNAGPKRKEIMTRGTIDRVIAWLAKSDIVTVDPAAVEDREVLTGDHCFGCTAGAGSSCGGALV